MIEDQENTGQFSKGIGRSTYVLGSAPIRKDIQNTLKGLTFINDSEISQIHEPHYNLPFLIVGCDFNDEKSVTATLRCLKRLKEIPAIKVLYVTGPQSINLEHLVFSYELGCSFVAGSGDRNNKLKTYLKTSSLSTIDPDIYHRWEKQISICIGKNDSQGIRKVAATLVSTGKENPDVLKLLVRISHYLAETKKEISYLNRMLKINRQDLWAASQIGKLHLDCHQITKGIEILQYETDFSLDRSYKIDFKNGVLAKLQLDSLTDGILSFLNLRAVMSIRGGEVRDGINFYTIALAGCQKDLLAKSKLHYNIGLAYGKINSFESAIYHLEQSLKLGHPLAFTKAHRPLENFRKQLLDFQNSHATPITPTDKKKQPEKTSSVKEGDELDLTDN